MKQDLLFSWGQAGVADAAMLLTMSGNAWWRGGALSAQCGLCRLSGSRDIISLVTPRLGGNKHQMGLHKQIG